MIEGEAFMPDPVPVGAVYVDYATKMWKKPVLDQFNHKRLLKLMDKCVATSWPEGKKYWEDKRTENLQKGLKHMADIAFLNSSKHAQESKP